jgi:hypothetical protein
VKGRQAETTGEYSKVRNEPGCMSNSAVLLIQMTCLHRPEVGNGGIVPMQSTLREYSSKWGERLKRTPEQSSREGSSCDKILAGERERETEQDCRELNEQDLKKSKVESSATRPDLIRSVSEWKPFRRAGLAVSYLVH